MGDNANGTEPSHLKVVGNTNGEGSMVENKREPCWGSRKRRKELMGPQSSRKGRICVVHICILLESEGGVASRDEGRHRWKGG